MKQISSFHYGLSALGRYCEIGAPFCGSRCNSSTIVVSIISPAGGHLGRFIVWTKSAFEKLDAIFGTQEKKSLLKKDYILPRNIMGNPDLARIINSDEIQSIVRPTKVDIKRRALKKNPLKNLGALLKLNPYAKTARRMELLAQERQAKAKAEKLESKRKAPKVLFCETGLLVFFGSSAVLIGDVRMYVVQYHNSS